MNAKLLLAAVATAIASSTAIAAEPTQFIDPPSSLSRAQAQALDARASGAIVASREATQFADADTRRSRDAVRAETKAAPLHTASMKECPYVGG